MEIARQKNSADGSIVKATGVAVSEWQYCFQERLAICTEGKREPTAQEIEMAEREADLTLHKIINQ